ncbi:MAG: sigma-54 dependent transcriptional regulator [Alphaproteobacteria bacterium]|nr:sigma-54 dependent transcriptional regulator [Alphaproteobacteria bacterium]
MPRILVIDDEEASCRTLKLHFDERGFDVETALSAVEGLEKLEGRPADVVISDIRMPGRDGLSLLGEIQSRYAGLPVIMITAYQDLESTVAAMHAGAVDYVPKPIDLEELEAAVDRAVALRADEGDDGLVVDSGAAAGTIIGRSRGMKEVFKSIGMVSQSRVTVLILGESGTGKELVARAIHKASPDAAQPFVAVNCAALVETLLESEMFGHERGAFTGAVASRKGKVELAGEGALFLDEVSELSPRMQGKLLRLLEEREYSPVGSTATKISKARFITATNVDLTERVRVGEFREDLFYRLNVVNIQLPPLRERPGDIPVLVEHLLKKINREVRKGVRRVPSEVLDTLIAYTWPGNVRQLENVLMKAVVLAQGDVLNLADLPDEISGDRTADSAAIRTEPETGREAGSGASLKDVERHHIERVLASTSWHKGRACQILGISRPRLERRIREYGLEPQN